MSFEPPMVDRTFWIEVGFRAALHAERHQRDMRWWYGVWARKPR